MDATCVRDDFESVRAILHFPEIQTMVSAGLSAEAQVLHLSARNKGHITLSNPGRMQEIMDTFRAVSL